MTVETVTEEETTVQEPQEDAQEPVEEQEPQEPTEQVEDAETFSRDYVEKLRKESAGYRERAKRSDDLAHRLHSALVTATGKLADARDLPYDDAHLESPEALDTAIQGLLTDRPHLAARKPRGSVGQGATSAGTTVDLAGLLRARAN